MSFDALVIAKAMSDNFFSFIQSPLIKGKLPKSISTDRSSPLIQFPGCVIKFKYRTLHQATKIWMNSYKDFGKPEAW